MDGSYFRIVRVACERKKGRTDSSRDTLNPLTTPVWCIEGVRKVLRLVYDLAVMESHDAHDVGRTIRVIDHVFRDPEIAVTLNSPDLETRRPAGMMTAQRLQIASSKDALA